MSRLDETTLLLDQEAGVSLKTEPAAKTSTRRRVGVAVAVSTLAILAIGADNTNQTIINKVNKINGMVNEFAAIETKPGGNDNWNTAGPVVAPGDGAAAAAAKAAAGMDETESEGNTLDIDAVAASVVAAAKKAVAVAECAAEGLEWPCHDVGSTIVANNGGYYYGDITNDGGI